MEVEKYAWLVFLTLLLWARSPSETGVEELCSYTNGYVQRSHGLIVELQRFRKGLC